MTNAQQLDDITNILTDIKRLLEQIVESHSCGYCKVLVPNGAIICPNCGGKNP
jgi:hypothetical protein